MRILKIADSIAIELRLFGLIGVFQYDKFHISFLVSALFVLILSSMFLQHTLTLVYIVENIDQLTDLLYVVGIFTVVCGKLSGLILNRDKLTNILNGLNEKYMFPSDWIGTYRSEISKTIRHIRLSSRFLTCLVYTAVLSVIIESIANQKLMFTCYFPFETRYGYSPEGYWTAYLCQTIYCIYIIQSNISTDIFTMALLHSAAVKLKVIRFESQKLCTNKNGCIENMKAIRILVNFHIETVKFIEDIENCFNFGLFVQCCVSGLSICVIMLKAILYDITTEINQLMSMVIVLSAFLNQLFYYCHYGNQIKHQQASDLLIRTLSNYWSFVFSLVVLVYSAYGYLFDLLTAYRNMHLRFYIRRFCYEINERSLKSCLLNNIKFQSGKLFASIYECRWYKLHCRCLNVDKCNLHTRSIKRSIFIMLERTKRPTIVTAGRLIKLTYESFIMICRTGYQAFAVLRDIFK